MIKNLFIIVYLLQKHANTQYKNTSENIFFSPMGMNTLAATDLFFSSRHIYFRYE